MLSLRVAGPRGAPRDAKEAGAKVYPLVSFPVRTRRPARVLRAPSRARASVSRTDLATPAGATLGSAAKSGCLDAARGHRQQISYYNNSTPSTRSTQLPGRLAARSIGCLYSTPACTERSGQRDAMADTMAMQQQEETLGRTMSPRTELPGFQTIAEMQTTQRTSIGFVKTPQYTSTPPRRRCSGPCPGARRLRIGGLKSYPC